MNLVEVELLMRDFESLDGNDDWDQEYADELIGRTLLVGITYFTSDGTLKFRRQVFGTVDECDSDKGIAIRQHSNGEIFKIPPMLESIEHGGPGVYQLNEDDEEITDPDYTAWVKVTDPVRS